jgi:hypothetical protein
MITNAKKIFVLLIIILPVILFTSLPCKALNQVTHKAINKYIADKGSSLVAASLHEYLQQQLGMQKGLEEFVNNKMIFDWIGDGGEYEDSGGRVVNHFLDPVTNKGLLIGQSALVWATLPVGEQNLTPISSWNDVRAYYYKALTSINDSVREEYFALTFQGLGQVMHLVQDMSIPAHARNDMHPSAGIIGKGDPFEKWAEKHITNQTPFSTSYPAYNYLPHQAASFLIPQLFDTDQYNGNNPDITVSSGSIGLAEYTNANFLSAGTVFKHYDYPSYKPAISVAENPQTIDGNVILYLKKIDEGQTMDFFARAGLFFNKLTGDYKALALTVDDDLVHKNYADLLLPRAIGYSAQVLNFFFRGALEISLPENEGAYALAKTDDGFDQIVLAVKNTSAAAEEMPDGEIHLIVKYKLALEDPFQNQPVPASDNFFYKVVPEKNGIRSIPRAPVVLTFDLSAGKIPVWATDVYLQVVYKGRMGAETNAIAVGFKDISEPTPFDYINSPKTCCYGEWLVSGSPEAVAKADTNGDGVADYDVYPHLFRNVYVKISSVTTPEEKIVASESNHTYKIDALPSGQYNRVYILGDEEFNTHLRLTWTPVDPRDTFPEFEDIMDEYFIQNTVTHQNVREPTQKCCELWGTPSCGTSYSDPNCCERLYENGCTVRYYPQLKKFMDVYRWAVIRSWMRVGYTNCTLDTYETPAP